MWKSSTITESGGNTMARPVNRMRPVHPGEVLREDYLVPLGLSVNALAVALGVPATRIHEIVKERRAVTADTAARLARYFGGDAASWLVMQANYDLKTLPTLEDIERAIPVREQLAA
jgi:addiction module HigA family antidote